MAFTWAALSCAPTVCVVQFEMFVVGLFFPVSLWGDTPLKKWLQANSDWMEIRGCSRHTPINPKGEQLYNRDFREIE